MEQHARCKEQGHQSNRSWIRALHVDTHTLFLIGLRLLTALVAWRFRLGRATPELVTGAQAHWAEIEAASKTVSLSPGRPTSLRDSDCELMRFASDAMLAKHTSSVLPTAVKARAKASPAWPQQPSGVVVNPLALPIGARKAKNVRERRCTVVKTVATRAEARRGCTFRRTDRSKSRQDNSIRSAYSGCAASVPAVTTSLILRKRGANEDEAAL